MGTIVYYTTGILLAFVALFIFLERKFPYTKGLSFFREGFWLDLVWYTFIQSYFLKILIFDYIIQPLDVKFHWSSHLVTSWPLAMQILFFLVTHDFYIYWFHRLQHTSKFFWRTHEAHHSNKKVDWLAGSRSHTIEIIINQTIEFAPIILLGANPLVVPIKALIDAVWGMYIHSNINVKSGKLQYVINGPEMHQWHHANDRRVFWANYSTKFAVWDWIFGTAFLPKEEKPSEFGLYYEYPKDYFAQHAFAVKRFDENKLLEKKPVKDYYELRPRLIKWLTRTFKIATGKKITAEDSNKETMINLDKVEYQN
ncbi:sterol desaturase family protein [Ferruginibacter albus]|uniref:sterol desaturase family protein n=1 Tax=Ferruginibacter albus TaxID=2875540 RepID=UPI001CC8261A|nr:sterol desaturase family protein [Ferruginibacter albus]UAY51520.1 sterol desaturase family protein [Ferruginibacter albus]